MAHVLPLFVPFSQSYDLNAEVAPPTPAPGSSQELRRRAEAAKDRIYLRHVCAVLNESHSRHWSSLTRDQKLALVGQVAEQNARQELAEIAGKSRSPYLSHWDLVGEYLRVHNLSTLPDWSQLRDEDRDRTFFAAAVRRFLRQVTEEVLRELRTESWSTAASPDAVA